MANWTHPETDNNPLPRGCLGVTLDDEIDKLEEEIKSVERKTSQSSSIAIGLGVFAIVVSIPWISGIHGFEAGFGAAAGIGIVIWGISLKDSENRAQRELQNLQLKLKNLRSRL